MKTSALIKATLFIGDATASVTRAYLLSVHSTLRLLQSCTSHGSSGNFTESPHTAQGRSNHFDSSIDIKRPRVSIFPTQLANFSYRTAVLAQRHALLLQKASHLSITNDKIAAYHRYHTNGPLDAARKWLFQEGRQVTNIIIAANVLFYVMEINNPGFIQQYAQINALVLARGEYYRLLSAAFLHGGPLHLLGNMLTLHYLAPELERTVGRGCFLALYLAGAIGGGAMHLLMGHMGSVFMGASGALTGLLGATLTFKIRNRYFVPFTSEDLNWIGQIVAINVMVALFINGISHWGHAGGFVGGGIAMFLLGPRYSWSNGFIVNKPILPLFSYNKRL
ncbi:hypothetical protein CEUSTIGMA_g7301.t1 [Chlamydomonas eustigma]|uniref:Peptidase S54 rhomboid domain-containing protein n=1 Tax=Chlamydomonas eustigma TaxID=1157962 RepID=A0A250X9U2_9CHLO|nr:hypothetical protein CEUSTIGMA_g7301.t1 [Chlamydomonas eustigma]|eukprot:GAX79861.1 hypothetical protein CEUSTIGMA_g7301.t1 [Chlamydomonas eustigma]